jgi:hypothetical protein
MSLTEEQKQRVTEWIQSGLKLSEIQERLGSEFDLRMTYMDVRLLVDDLKLTPKETVVPEPAKAAPAAAAAPEGEPTALDDPLAVEPAGPAPALSGKVSVVVDQITRAGAMVSGKASFSDGQTAEWYMDNYGRLGFVPAQQGYRPAQEEVAEFQMLLDRELAKLGY